MSVPDRDRRGLALIGMHGSGKSTVGAILAERLRRRFLDADLELERRAGRSIAAIFADEGEPAFRDREARVLAELTAANPDAVLATGGGVVLRPANCAVLRSFGFVVWIQGDPAEAAARLLAERRQVLQRPALTAAGTLDELATVLRLRTPLYEALADAVVTSDGRSAAAVAEAILDVWRPVES